MISSIQPADLGFFSILASGGRLLTMGSHDGRLDVVKRRDEPCRSPGRVAVWVQFAQRGARPRDDT